MLVERNSKNRFEGLPYLSLVLFIVSLFLPCFDDLAIYGFVALFLGWIGMFSTEFFIGLTWSANIFILLSIILFRLNLNYRIALSFIGVVMTFFVFGVKKIPADESGAYYEISSLGIGYVLWAISFILIFIYFVFERKSIK